MYATIRCNPSRLSRSPSRRPWQTCPAREAKCPLGLHRFSCSRPPEAEADSPLPPCIRPARLPTYTLSRLGPLTAVSEGKAKNKCARPFPTLDGRVDARAHFFPHYCPLSLAFSRAAIAPPPWLMRFGHRRRLVSCVRMPAAGCRGKARIGQGGEPCSSCSSGSLPPRMRRKLKDACSWKLSSPAQTLAAFVDAGGRTSQRRAGSSQDGPASRTHLPPSSRPCHQGGQTAPEVQ